MLNRREEVFSLNKLNIFKTVIKLVRILVFLISFAFYCRIFSLVLKQFLRKNYMQESLLSTISTSILLIAFSYQYAFMKFIISLLTDGLARCVSTQSIGNLICSTRHPYATGVNLIIVCKGTLR